MAEDTKGEVYLPDGRLIESLKVVELKQELKKHGLSLTGSKSQLAERLKAQIYLEELKQAPVMEGVPNRDIVDDASVASNSFIQQYLKQQQEQLRQRHAREAPVIPEALTSQVEELNESLSHSQSEESEKSAEDAEAPTGDVSSEKEDVVEAAGTERPAQEPSGTRSSRRSRRGSAPQEDGGEVEQESRKSRRMRSRSRGDSEHEEEQKISQEAEHMETIDEQSKAETKGESAPVLEEQDVPKTEESKGMPAAAAGDKDVPATEESKEEKKSPSDHKDDIVPKVDSREAEDSVVTEKEEAPQPEVTEDAKGGKGQEDKPAEDDRADASASKPSDQVEQVEVRQDIKEIQPSPATGQEASREEKAEEVKVQESSSQEDPIAAKDDVQTKDEVVPDKEPEESQSKPSGEKEPEREKPKSESDQLDSGSSSQPTQKKVKLNRFVDLSRAALPAKPVKEDQKPDEDEQKMDEERPSGHPEEQDGEAGPKDRSPMKRPQLEEEDASRSTLKRRKTESDDERDGEAMEQQEVVREEGATTAEEGTAPMDAAKENGRNGTSTAAMETEEGEIKEEGEEIEEGQVVEDDKMEESSKPPKLSAWPVFWEPSPG